MNGHLLCGHGLHAYRLEHLYRARILPNYEPETRVYVCWRCGAQKWTETDVIFNNGQVVNRSPETRIKKL